MGAHAHAYNIFININIRDLKISCFTGEILLSYFCKFIKLIYIN